MEHEPSGQFDHTPVLPREALACLSPGPGETAVDLTAGLGGHAAVLGQAVGPDGTVVLNDLDAGNLARAVRQVRSLTSPPRVIELHGNFAQVARRLSEGGIVADVLLADLGFSSSQMDDPLRGLSFRSEGPLDMRFDTTSAFTAGELVNRASVQELWEIIRDYGEERYARHIAEKLVAARQSHPIETTSQLAEIIRSAIGRASRGQRIDPATRTFQALRIAVNDELGNLRALLAAIDQEASGGPDRSVRWLAHGARIGIISFHSLEDRPVKRAFSELASRSCCEMLTRKPLRASAEEQAANRRSRSAKLRAIRVF